MAAIAIELIGVEKVDWQKEMPTDSEIEAMTPGDCRLDREGHGLGALVRSVMPTIRSFRRPFVPGAFANT